MASMCSWTLTYFYVVKLETHTFGQEILVIFRSSLTRSCCESKDQCFSTAQRCGLRKHRDIACMPLLGAVVSTTALPQRRCRPVDSSLSSPRLRSHASQAKLALTRGAVPTNGNHVSFYGGYIRPTLRYNMRSSCSEINERCSSQWGWGGLWYCTCGHHIFHI